MKRPMDIMLSSVSLVALSPVLAAVAIAIKISDGGPVFYVQERMGKDFRPFRLYKFRTMTENHRERHSGPSVTAAGDERVTRVGRVLRRTKLDELPQLLNILKGDMSIVGPRPEVYRYARFYESQYREILKGARPGLTDFATLEYIDEEKILASCSDPEQAYVATVLPAKLDLCLKYRQQASLSVDVRIMFRTFIRTLRRSI